MAFLDFLLCIQYSVLKTYSCLHYIHHQQFYINTKKLKKAILIKSKPKIFLWLDKTPVLEREKIEMFLWLDKEAVLTKEKTNYRKLQEPFL